MPLTAQWSAAAPPSAMTTNDQWPVASGASRAHSPAACNFRLAGDAQQLGLSTLEGETPWLRAAAYEGEES